MFQSDRAARRGWQITLCFVLVGEREPVQPVERVAVDRHRQELALDLCEDTVLVGTPRREAR